MGSPVWTATQEFLVFAGERAVAAVQSTASRIGSSER